LVIIHKAAEGVSGTTLARFLNRCRRELKLAGEVTLLLASNTQLRRLNRQFRGKDYATDVLSFPSENPPRQRPKPRSSRTPAGYAGDIAISVDIARKNGGVLGHGVAAEIKTLILHGLLHLAGYDHESDHGQMARKELSLRRALGLPEGLIERADLDGRRPAKGKAARPAPATAEPGAGKKRVSRQRSEEPASLGRRSKRR
jgi:probable rRNA maturation factor